MKFKKLPRISIAFCFCMYAYFNLAAQGPGCLSKTLVLQPGADGGKDALIHGLSSRQNENFGNGTSLQTMTWTFDGEPGTVRFLMGFDVSSIPPGAVILSAKLTLYGLITQNGSGNSCLSGDNNSIIRRVTEPWDEATVTWNTQPDVTDDDAINVPPLCVPGADLEKDIHPLVQCWVDNPSANYGLQFAMAVEEFYRALIFHSSDTQDATKRPKLEIVYKDPMPCEGTMVLQPGPDCGKDALVHGLSSRQNENFGNNVSLQTMTWTFGGEPGTLRFFMDFDLSCFPPGTTIESADLVLSGLITPNGSGHSCLSGPNDAVISRVTAPWDESTITWNNQPPVSTPQVDVAPLCDPGVDLMQSITPLIQYLVDHPTENHGIQFALKVEDFYRAWIFHSSDALDPAKWPKLTIKYKKRCVCDDNIVQNGSFSEGLVPGDLDSPGQIDYWSQLFATPQVITGDSCGEFGAIQMWGNQVVGEGVQQTVNFKKGMPYEITFCGKWLPTVQGNVRVRFRASQGEMSHSSPGDYLNCSAGCEQISLSPILTDNWTTYTAYWIPTQDYDHLNITIWNDFNIDNGAYVSWARIDDVCIHKIPVGTHEFQEERLSAHVFPNPTTGDAMIEFDTPLPTNATLVLWDMLGRQVKQIEIQAGEKQFSIPMANLSAGLYTARILGNGIGWSCKVVKE